MPDPDAPIAARRVDRSTWLSFIAVALAAAGVIVLATRNGVGVFNDGTHYISAARSLAAGDGYRDFTRQPLTTFPPLLSALLAVGIKLGLSATAAARVVNTASFVAIAVLSLVLARRHLRSSLLATAAALLVVFSVELARVSHIVMSEPVFIVLALVGFLLFDDALVTTARRGDLQLALAGVVYGVAFLARYAAITFVVAGVVSLLVARTLDDSSPKLRRVAIFVGAWLPLPALWLFRNMTSGAADVMGPRVAVGGGVASTITRVARATGAVFLSDGAPNVARYAIAACVALLVVVAAWLALTAPDTVARSSRSMVPLLIALVSYVGFVWVSYWRAGSSLDARIMAPVAPFVAVTAAYVVEELPRRWAPRLGDVARTVARAAFIGVVIVAGILTVRVANSTGTGDPGEYVDPALREQPLSRAIEGLPNRSLVVTNKPYFVYYVTGHEPTDVSPGRLVPVATLERPSLAALRRTACTRPVYLAWFGPANEAVEGLTPPTELVKRVTLHTINRSEQGTLYELPRAPSCPERA